MATNPLPNPRVRRWLNWIVVLPMLCIAGIYGYLFYRRVSHSASPERVISGPPFATVKVGESAASLYTQGNQIRPTGNDLYLEFRDGSGQLTNVGTVSFEMSLKMPGMVMHTIGKVFPTSTPGRFRTTIQPQMGGDWTARVSLRNARGAAETNFDLTVK